MKIEERKAFLLNFICYAQTTIKDEASFMNIMKELCSAFGNPDEILGNKVFDAEFVASQLIEELNDLSDKEFKKEIRLFFLENEYPIPPEEVDPVLQTKENDMKELPRSKVIQFTAYLIFFLLMGILFLIDVLRD